MLRTALIGYPSTGKTTLFRLMTEAHEAPRAAHGEAGGDAGHRPRARPAPGRAHGDVQPAEARAGHRRVRGHPRPPVRNRRRCPARRRGVPERRCARARGASVHGPGDPARGRVGRSAAGRAGDGRRADPGGPRGRGEAARAPGEGPEEVAHRGPREGAGDPAPVQAAPRERLAAAGAGARGRRPPPPARVPVPLGQAAAARAQRRRARSGRRAGSPASSGMAWRRWPPDR